MKQKEKSLVRGWIFMVQHLDTGYRPLKQYLILGQNLLRRVAKIRQQGEVQVLIPIREMMDFQSLDQAINPGQAREHGGNHHHSPAIGRDAGRIIQAREQAGFHQQRGQPVHQRHGQLAGAKESNKSKEYEFPSLHCQRLGLLHKHERGEQSHCRDTAHIKCQRKTADAALDNRTLGPSHIRHAPQHGVALVYQIEAHMCGSIFVSL